MSEGAVVAGIALGSSLAGRDPFSGTRSRRVKPAYCTSAVSLVSCLILSSKSRKPRVCNNLSTKGYLGKKKCLWIVAEIFGQRWSGKVAFAYRNAL